jgi:hypothetical protein
MPTKDEIRIAPIRNMNAVSKLLAPPPEIWTRYPTIKGDRNPAHCPAVFTMPMARPVISLEMALTGKPNTTPLLKYRVNPTAVSHQRSASEGSYYLHATGGSSGVPTRFYVTIDSYTWRSAATSRAYSWTGLRMGEHTKQKWFCSRICG